MFFCCVGECDVQSFVRWYYGLSRALALLFGRKGNARDANIFKVVPYVFIGKREP